MENIETNIHYLINLIGHVPAAKTFHLTLQRSAQNIFNHKDVAAVGIASVAFPAELLEAETGAVAGADDVAEELLHVLLATTTEMLNENPEIALDLRKSVMASWAT
ncbi:peptidase U32 family [Sesbania bispinosa]|nr:peptidase U32 family [Sesbania bispinosa]KAJ1395750.1 peptidase U32 family [Sesbania bispinosa]